MDKPTTAMTIAAFSIVELGIQMPLEEFYKMSPSDPLYTELVDMWSRKQEREDRRTALICATLCNVMGGSKGKPITVDDFMPQKPKTQEQVEAEFKARLLMYHTAKVEK